MIFAASLLVIFGVAALVFDGGLMLLEKRDQQNAADAAAIAGARFLPDDQVSAEAEARDVATINGFTDGTSDQLVTVTFPTAGQIEVAIEDKTPSFFAGIWGIFEHEVGSRAVAINDDRPLGPFGMLALNPQDCGAIDIGGTGEVVSNGDIHTNSDCMGPPGGALTLRGTGEIVTAPDVACNVVGNFSAGGASDYNCDVAEGPPVVPIPDPFLGLDPYEPPIPTDGSGAIAYPTPPVQEGGGAMDIPTGCPGSATPASEASPNLCRYTASYSGTTWRLYPGYYPGGLHLIGGSFYLEPGIYYVAGGGLLMNGGDASIMSVATGGTTVGGGILIYNGDHATEPDGDVQLTGGDSGVNLLPLGSGTYEGLVVYQDAQICLDVVLNGASSTMSVRGTIYVPCGNVSALGNGGTIITDQIVADTFSLSGNIGSLQVLYDDTYLPTVRLAGLIE